jgi:Tol biopolymer transport system component
MRQLVTVIIVGVLLAGSLVAQQKPQEIALQAAMRTETVAGDLRGAIAQYEAILDKYAKTDRAVAAMALVRMAECHQRLGEQQATRLFERVLREYADQKNAVAIATTRLGQSKAVATSTGMINRQVWTGRSVDAMGTISGDGRTLSFTDWETGDLALRDMRSGSTRHLTNKGSWSTSDDFAEFSAISRDGAQVAYAWWDAKASRYQVRVISAEGTPGSVRTLFDNPDVRWIAPHDWSPDGKWLAVQLQRVDRTAQLGLVGVADGAFRALRSTDWRGTTRMFFSPDGSLMAYDLSQADDTHARDVLVLSVDGTKQFTVAPHAAHDVALGWSPDGKSLLLASDRAGSMGLWSVPMTNGQPGSRPSLIKPDIGHLTSSLGMSRTGMLLYAVRTTATTVSTASIDFDSGKFLSEPAFPFETYLSRITQPDWSRDGRLMVAVAEQSRTRSGLTIRTPDGKHVRDLAVALSYFGRPRWAPDGSITVQGSDFKGRQGFYRIDAASGDVAPLVLGDDASVFLGQASWLPDGQSLVFRRSMADGVGVVVRNVSSGDERLLVEHPSLRGLSVSPDGRTVAYVLQHRDRQLSTVVTQPAEGGEAKEIARIPAPLDVLNVTLWTPDGQRILFARGSSLWVVPSTGGTPRKLDVELGSAFAANSLRLHPDGRTVAFTAGETAGEVWTLENFLSAPAATSSRR